MRNRSRRTTKIVLIWAAFERTDRAHTGDQNGGYIA
jgi:hypothetical protein